MEYLCKCYMPACGNLESGNISDGNNELPFSFKYDLSQIALGMHIITWI